MSPEIDDEFGTLERGNEHSILRYQRHLSHPPEMVWRAITEPKHLAGWFPTTIDGDREAGAALRFVFPNGEGPTFDGMMLAFEPPSLLELQWADDVLRFELQPEGSGCVLNLTVTFPEHGKAARDAGGWHVCLERLSYLLAEVESPTEEPDRWREINAEYKLRFGPEASSIGPPEEWERVHGTGSDGS